MVIYNKSWKRRFLYYIMCRIRKRRKPLLDTLIKRVISEQRSNIYGLTLFVANIIPSIMQLNECAFYLSPKFIHHLWICAIFRFTETFGSHIFLIWRLFFIFLHLAKYTSKKVLRHTISITRWYQHCLIFQRTKMWTIKIKKPRKESNGHRILLSRQPYIFTDMHFAL